MRRDCDGAPDWSDCEQVNLSDIETEAEQVFTDGNANLGREPGSVGTNVWKRGTLKNRQGVGNEMRWGQFVNTLVRTDRLNHRDRTDELETEGQRHVGHNTVAEGDSESFRRG
jgi:hypothetical protein